jgi:hypothetical protein
MPLDRIQGGLPRLEFKGKKETLTIPFADIRHVSGAENLIILETMNGKLRFDGRRFDSDWQRAVAFLAKASGT